MRRVFRRALPAGAAAYLLRKQQKLDNSNRAVEPFWNGARKTKTMGSVVQVLKEMAGPRERCMYCADSHGCDVEHFWPKARYRSRVFQWENLLWCCTECGRFKLDRFPLAGQTPLLVDPSVEDPWQFLDFDPQTGIISPRWDIAANQSSVRGKETAELFHFEKREALARGYRLTWWRLGQVVRGFLDGRISNTDFVDALIEADDHGLLGWCFTGLGLREAPFRELRERYPQLWAECHRRLASG